MPLMPVFDPIRFGVELTYTLIAAVLFFLIFFRTKEFYSLSKYKGILFFRSAFLWFALSYLLRFLLILSKLYFDRPPSGFFRAIFPANLLFVSYFSSLGIVFLIFSITWKHLNSDNLVLFGHIISAFFAIIIFLTNSPEILMYFQIFLLIVATVLGLIFDNKSSKSNKASQTRVLYFLLLLSWLLNIWMLTPGWFFSNEIKSLFQFFSLIVFVTIYYKVSRWLK